MDSRAEIPLTPERVAELTRKAPQRRACQLCGDSTLATLRTATGTLCLACLETAAPPELNDLAEFKLRAERRAGELLRAMPKARNQHESPSQAARGTLPDLGITHSDSSRWQAEAKVSDEEFDE